MIYCPACTFETTIIAYAYVRSPLLTSVCEKTRPQPNAKTLHITRREGAACMAHIKCGAISARGRGSCFVADWRPIAPPSVQCDYGLAATRARQRRTIPMRRDGIVVLSPSSPPLPSLPAHHPLAPASEHTRIHRCIHSRSLTRPHAWLAKLETCWRANH